MFAYFTLLSIILLEISKKKGRGEIEEGKEGKMYTKEETTGEILVAPLYITLSLALISSITMYLENIPMSSARIAGNTMPIF